MQYLFINCTFRGYSCNFQFLYKTEYDTVAFIYMYIQPQDFVFWQLNQTESGIKLADFRRSLVEIWRHSKLSTSNFLASVFQYFSFIHNEKGLITLCTCMPCPLLQLTFQAKGMYNLQGQDTIPKGWLQGFSTTLTTLKRKQSK
jgi:hypothetical protein